MTEPLTNDQIFISKLTDIVLTNLENENFGVNDLARESGFSLYAISRKLYSLKKIRASRFIREVRLQKALEMLRNGDYTASEVSFKVGFGSPAYFNRCFREFFGCTPGDLKKTNLNGKASDITESETEGPDADKKEQTRPGRKKKFSSLPIILVLALITVLVFNVLYNKILVPEWTDDLKSSEGRISIAIMPFQNMTNDTLWNIWQEGIQEGLASVLSNYKELKVLDEGSVNALLQAEGFLDYSVLSPGIAGKISQKLDARIFVSGSIKQADSILRIDAQLTDVKTNELIKSFITELPAKEKNVFQSADELSIALKNFLLISKRRKDNPVHQHYALPSTNSPEAFRYYIYGDQAAARSQNASAILWYNKALEADSNYFDPMQGLSTVYSREGNSEKNYEWVVRYFKKRDQFSFEDQLRASWAYAFSFEPPEESIKYLRQLQQMDDQSPRTYYLIGITYNLMKQYNKAIPELEKNMEICRRWGKEFMKNNSAYSELGLAYHQTGQYKKEKKIYKLAEKFIPDDPGIYGRRAILALTEKDTTAANRYFEEYIVAHRQRYPNDEAEIPWTRGWIYREAGFPDIAEEFFRKSISMDPDNPARLYKFANFLINHDRKLEDIQGLMDRAMVLAPNKMDYYKYMDMKGRGLLKQGKSSEALEILEKTYNSTPYKVWFICSDLMKAREAVANLK